MAILEYRDFILIAEDVAKDENEVTKQFTVRVFDSPVGQGEKKETVAIPDGLFKLIRRLEKRRLDNDVERQMDLGELLAGLLLPDYARKLFSQSLGRLRDGEGLRLRLRLADELADFPWEFMYIQDHRGERTPSSFLALDPRISIVRHEAIAVPGDWFEGPDHRRLVVAMATPEPHKKYPKLQSLPTEQIKIKEALKKVAGLKAVFLPDYPTSEGNGISSATLKDLMAAFTEKTDIFHFSGHGEFVGTLGPAFGSIIGEGGLVLADMNNQALTIAADRLAELVLRGKGIRLVVLGACETGRRDSHNVWSSVAASLLKAGIPAVVAMQFTIKDFLAAAFSGMFYQALVAGCTVDEAVTLGRGAMRAEALTSQRDIRDWGVPVLYLRAPGGRVFNPVRNAEARKDAEQAVVEQRVKQEVGTITGRVVGADISTMLTGSVKVEQQVSEEIKGVMIGADVFRVEGGVLNVEQSAGVVSGELTGIRIGTSSKDMVQPEREEQVIEDLEDLLRLDPEPRTGEINQKPRKLHDRLSTTTGAKRASPQTPNEPICPNCNRPVEAEWKSCPFCQTELQLASTCPQCRKTVESEWKVCPYCGVKLLK